MFWKRTRHSTASPTLPSSSRHRCCFLAVVAVFFCTAATTLNNRDLQFQVTIPDGFEPNKEHSGGRDDLYSFVRPATNPSKVPAVIVIRRLRGTLPPDFAVKGGTKDGVRIEPMPMTWKTFTIPGAKAFMDAGGEAAVTVTVQVPLKTEAISISVAGRLADEQEVSELLRSVLASVEAETDWIEEGGKVTTEKMVEAEKKIAKDASITVAILAVIALVIYIRWRNRRDVTAVES